MHFSSPRLSHNNSKINHTFNFSPEDNRYKI